MRRFSWKAASAALLAGLVSAGCGTQAKWVNCEGRLEPINQHASNVVGEPVREDPARTERAAP
jgi:hypothetical protein